MKLIRVTDAAARLGVTSQTIENWGKSGCLKIKTMGKSGKGHWVDEDTISALGDTWADVEHARQVMEAERQEIEDARKNFRAELKEIRREAMMLKRVGQAVVCENFYLSIPEMLCSLGVINCREVQVMRRVISGEPIGYIAEYFGVTKNAILGIFGRGCRKARHLEDIKKRLDEAEAMKAEIAELKQTVAVLNRDLKSQREVEEEQRKMEEAELKEHIARTDSLLKLLNTNIVDWDLPVRALNCLKAIDVETIGDLVRLNKVDLLKARNFGKRSLGEVEDLIIGLGLGFGMDVDKIYRERIAMKMKEYGKADGESE